MTDIKITLTGDPNKCKNCGNYRRNHDLIGKCPGERFGFFKSAFNYDGNLDVEHTDFPVCPHCGCEDEEWYETASNVQHDGDTARITCYKCENEFELTLGVSYSFTTCKIDFDAEKEAAKKEKEKREKAIEAVKKFTPGMRVLIKDKTYRKGGIGIVENKERMNNGYVSVISDDRNYSNFYNPEDLEAI